MIDENSNEMVPLSDQETQEVEEILRRFNNPAVHRQKVTKIERICNPEMERIYEMMKEMLTGEKKPTDEVLMFHGTASRNVKRYLSVTLS